MENKFLAFKNYIKGKNISVIGIGISNRPLIKLLLESGARVTAHDKKSEEQLGDVAKELKEQGVSLVLGENYMDEIKGEIVFKTPGLRFDHPSLLKAKENGSQITSEMEVFMEVCPSKVIAVTGSDGKTTTTTLIYKMLCEEGFKTYLGGNIGTPLLENAGEMTKDDYVVLELSSFQLHTMKKSPHIAVMTNITPNHLDMHKDYEEYIDAKKNIMLYQNENDILVVNSENDVTNNIGKEAKGRKISFSSKKEDTVYIKNESIYYGNDEILKIKDIKVPGKHNVENYMAAIGALFGIVSKETINNVAKTFGGVPHRIEFVRELDGVKYYNSSIDSSPNRTINTLNVFKDNVVLIAGGKDKGIPYDEIGKPILEHVKALVLIGATSDVINEAVKKASDGEIKIPVFFETEYKNAVLRAKNQAKEGDIVLLSNASTSFDMFNNFEQRGNLFKELVNNL